MLARLHLASPPFALILASPLLIFALLQPAKGLPTSALLLYIGALMGAALNYFHFGFSSSFRELLSARKTSGMRAIIWMLGIAILLFAPLLAMESWQQQNFNGFIRTIGLALPVGAFIFGIGMQIGCGCTSGTLNRAGQLQPLSFTTLFFMVIGGTFAAYSYDTWNNWPALEPFAFQFSFGWMAGLAVQLVILAALYWLLSRVEQQRHARIEPLWKSPTGHPFLLAGISLAILNASLLFISGQPWSIASIFPYWGSRLIDLLNLPMDWSFWSYTMENATRMNQGWLDNPVSLTTLGVILGALTVSLIKPREKVAVTLRGFSASVVGGSIMGLGAVMASGCNIGAFFSGIASGSGHGWVWLVFALMGNYVGVKLRQKARLG